MDQTEKQEGLWRVFCAVELPGSVRTLAAEHIARLRRAVPEAKASWVRADNLHVTLKFLGEMEPERALTALSGAAARAADKVTPFELKLEGTGSFPSRGVPRVLWLGIRDRSDSLALVQQRLEDECASENFARESRPFNPHLTIARLRTPVRARELASIHQETQFETEVFGVTELFVFRSELGPGGSRYTALARHRLGGTGT